MRKFFAKGLIALLPLVLTVAVVYFVVSFLHTYVGVPIGNALKWGVGEFAGVDPAKLKATDPLQWFFTWGAPLAGFVLAILLTFLMGFVVATFLGKKLFKLFEAIFRKLPVVRTVYPYAKQFTDFIFSDGEKKMEFKNAVAVPFPTHGVYSIGLVTGDGMRALNDATRKRMMCVFVPTAPTPFTGYVIYVPREDVIPLPITVEEAMRIIISAGVLHPAHQAIRAGDAMASEPHPAVPEALAPGIAGPAKDAKPS
jgi:uncharacterized membrane protein